MDDNSKFTLIAKRILRELRALNETVGANLLAVQKQVEKQTEATHKAEDAVQKEQSLPEAALILNAIESIGRDYRESQRAQDGHHNKTFWVSVVGVMVVAAYTTFTALQWFDLRDNFKVEQRAWVVPFDLSAEPFTGDPIKTIFKVLFKNTGRTPALKTHAWIAATPDLQSIPVTNPEELSGADAMILGPNGIGNTSTQKPYPPEAIQLIKKGVRLYIYGTIWYQDVFGKHHWTQFCYYPGTDLKGFGPCPIHNTCDDCGTTK
jgi:hypothetical protein